MISSWRLLLAVATAVECFDVVVYGGTSGGVAAAVQAAPDGQIGRARRAGNSAVSVPAAWALPISVIKAPSAASHASFNSAPATRGF